MNFCIFGNLSAIVETSKNYYFQPIRSHCPKSFTAYAPELKTIPILIILEPFIIKQTYFTISPVWKRYLAIHSPDTKHMIMGFLEHRSSNYIDLLNLPENLQTCLENALPVSADWDIPIDGANVVDYLQRFFAGHGEESLLSKLTALRQTLNIAYTNLADGTSNFIEICEKLLLPYGKSEWQELISRWKDYSPYFEYLPFYPTMQEIDASFSEISEIFACTSPDEKIFFELSAHEELNGIHRKLVELDQRYIRPELYNETQDTHY